MLCPFEQDWPKNWPKIGPEQGQGSKKNTRRRAIFFFSSEISFLISF